MRSSSRPTYHANFIALSYMICHRFDQLPVFCRYHLARCQPMDCGMNASQTFPLAKSFSSSADPCRELTLDAEWHLGDMVAGIRDFVTISAAFYRTEEVPNSACGNASPVGPERSDDLTTRRVSLWSAGTCSAINRPALLAKRGRNHLNGSCKAWLRLPIPVPSRASGTFDPYGRSALDPRDPGCRIKTGLTRHRAAWRMKEMTRDAQAGLTGGPKRSAEFMRSGLPILNPAHAYSTEVTIRGFKLENSSIGSERAFGVNQSLIAEFIKPGNPGLTAETEFSVILRRGGEPDTGYAPDG